MRLAVALYAESCPIYDFLVMLTIDIGLSPKRDFVNCMFAIWVCDRATKMLRCFETWENAVTVSTRVSVKKGKVRDPFDQHN